MASFRGSVKIAQITDKHADECKRVAARAAHIDLSITKAETRRKFLAGQPNPINVQRDFAAIRRANPWIPWPKS